MQGLERWKEAQRVEKRYHFGALRRIQRSSDREFPFDAFSVSSEFFENRDILEVGCGPLAAIHYFEKARFKAGLDPLASELHYPYAGGVYHIQGAGEHLPFRDGAFDIVLGLNVLDHAIRPISMLREVHRVLKHDGALLLWSNTYNTLGIFGKSLELIDRPHPHHFSEAELFDMIRETRFEVPHHSSRKVSPVVAFRQAHQPLPAISLVKHYVKYLGGALILGLHQSSFLCIKSER